MKSIRQNFSNSKLPHLVVYYLFYTPFAWELKKFSETCSIVVFNIPVDLGIFSAAKVKQTTLLRGVKTCGISEKHANIPWDTEVNL